MMCNARHSTSASVANSTIRSHSYHFGASMKHDARLWRTCKMPTRVLNSTSTDGQSLAGRSTSESLQTESHAVLENGKSSDNVIKLSPKNLTSTIYQLSRYDMHSNASSCPPKKIKKRKKCAWLACYMFGKKLCMKTRQVTRWGTRAGWNPIGL